MKYRVVIPDAAGTPCSYYFDHVFLAKALYRAAVDHGKSAFAFKMLKGRYVKLRDDWGTEEM